MKVLPAVEMESSDMTPMIDVVFQLLIFFMLTMQFKEVEGKLLSQLPKDVGPPSRPSLPREELRILIREGRLFVEKHEMGALGTSANKALYAAAAEKARGLADALGEPALVLDAEGSTSYEHVIGLLDALKERKLESVEFTGNPKLERYYKR